MRQTNAIGQEIFAAVFRLVGIDGLQRIGEPGVDPDTG